MLKSSQWYQLRTARTFSQSPTGLLSIPRRRLQTSKFLTVSVKGILSSPKTMDWLRWCLEKTEKRCRLQGSCIPSTILRYCSNNGISTVSCAIPPDAGENAAPNIGRRKRRWDNMKNIFATETQRHRDDFLCSSQCPQCLCGKINGVPPHLLAILTVFV